MTQDQVSASAGEALMTQPYIALAPRPGSSHLVLLTPSSVHIADVASSRLLSHVSALPFADPKANEVAPSSTTLICPRYAAWSAPSTAGEPSSFLAISGDDKILRIFQISHDGTQGLKLGEEVLLVYLQKRPCRLQWENAEGVVVGDRHGDIRVASVNRGKGGEVQRLVVGSPKRPPGGQSGQSKKKAKVEGNGEAQAESKVEDAAQEKDEEQEEEDVLLAAGLEPKVGHVGMLTSFHLSEPCGSSTVARSIISADRDEHIRVSRWGKDCLGYVVRRYLLGSLGAVGALAIVPPSAGDGHNALISGDGGDKLRIWDWTKDGHAKLVISLSSAVRGAVQVRASVEKMRERGGWQSDGSNVKMKDLLRNGINKRGNKAKAQEDESVRKAMEDSAYPEIISRIEVLQPRKGGPTQVLFLLDGSTTLFHLTLDEVLKHVKWDSSDVIPEEVDLARSVKSVELGSPIIDVALLEHGGERLLAVACDTRPGVMTRSSEGEGDAEPVKTEGKSLQLLGFSDEQATFTPVESSHALASFFEKASRGKVEGDETSLPVSASHSDVLRVALYNHLVQVPKLAAETRHVFSKARRGQHQQQSGGQSGGEAAQNGQGEGKGQEGKLSKRQLGRMKNRKIIDEAIQRAAEGSNEVP